MAIAVLGRWVTCCPAVFLSLLRCLFFRHHLRKQVSSDAIACQELRAGKRVVGWLFLLAVAAVAGGCISEKANLL